MNSKRKVFLYRWLMQLQEREPRLRGNKLKYNQLMQQSLRRDLNI